MLVGKTKLGGERLTCDAGGSPPGRAHQTGRVHRRPVRDAEIKNHLPAPHSPWVFGIAWGYKDTNEPLFLFCDFKLN